MLLLYHWQQKSMFGVSVCVNRIATKTSASWHVGFALHTVIDRIFFWFVLTVMLHIRMTMVQHALVLSFLNAIMAEDTIYVLDDLRTKLNKVTVTCQYAWMRMFLLFRCIQVLVCGCTSSKYWCCTWNMLYTDNFRSWQWILYQKFLYCHFPHFSSTIQHTTLLYPKDNLNQ